MVQSPDRQTDRQTEHRRRRDAGSAACGAYRQGRRSECELEESGESGDGEESAFSHPLGPRRLPPPCSAAPCGASPCSVVSVAFLVVAALHERRSHRQVDAEHGEEVADAVDRRSGAHQGGCTRGGLRRRDGPGVGAPDGVHKLGRYSAGGVQVLRASILPRGCAWAPLTLPRRPCMGCSGIQAKPVVMVQAC